MAIAYHLCQTLASIVARTAFRLEIIGRENFIQHGPAILAMNHQSYFDPPLAAVCSPRPIHFLARKTLFDVPLLGPLIRRLNVIGIDRDGNDMSALKIVIRLLRDGGSTIVFPEGTRTPDGQLQPARPGLGLIIAKTHAPVVPMRVFGAYEAFPRTARFPRIAPITVVVGKPLRFTPADTAGEPRDAYQRLSDCVMRAITALNSDRVL